MKLRYIIRSFVTLVCALALTLPVAADNRGKVGRRSDKVHGNVEKKHLKAHKKVESLRAKANKKVSKKLRDLWGDYVPQNPQRATVIDPVIPLPDDNPIPPPIDREQEAVIVDPVVVEPQPVPEPLVIEEPVVIREELIIEEPVIEEPVIEDIPVIEEKKAVPATFDIDVFGKNISLPKPDGFALGSMSSMGDRWDYLSDNDDYDALINSLYKATVDNNITGWATLDLTDRIAGNLTSDAASRAFLHAWLMVQLGYDMRLVETADGRLFSAFRTGDLILSSVLRNWFSLPIDGQRYYAFQDSGSSFPSFRSHASLGYSLKPVNLSVAALPSQVRGAAKNTRGSARVGRTLEVATPSPAMLKYYEDYPRFCPDGGSVVTQWFNYANAPISDATRATLADPLRAMVKDKAPLEAVNTILTFVQDAFPYGYDDKIWGYDRPFFPDESIYYPQSDCEDHAILFTRLVREILGLPCALVYYPNHLAAAVEIPGHVTGDYVNVAGRRFTICDPTYSRPAGYTMPGMDNSTAQVGLLP